MNSPSSSRPSARILALLAVAALPIVNFFLFGSFNLFSGNHAEFDSGFRDLLPHYLPAILILWLVFITPGLLLRRHLRERYICLLFGLGILIWAQGTFFAGDYGVLDGRGLEWKAFAWPAWLDIVVWVGVLAGAVAYYRHLIALVMPGTLALIVVQLVAATHVVTNTEESLWRGSLTIEGAPPRGIFQYSSERNVVQLILDNFQTDIFEELVREEGLENALDGFVLFRETAAVAPFTSLAIPSIMQGQVYDGSISASAFFNRAMEDGFHNHLHQQGYTVNLSTMRSMTGSSFDHEYRVPSVYGATAREINQKESSQLLDITLFRHAPHLARNWVYNGNNWRIQSVTTDPEELPKSFAHKRFFRDYMTRLELGSEVPAYHFLHLWPPHPPYVTTADGEYAGEVLPNTRDNYKNEAKDVLLHAIDFLESLKQLGVYDNSLILLHSDHGGAFEPQFTPPRVLAMMAIKPRSRRGPLRSSDAPVSLADIAATVIQEEGLDMVWSGKSVFDIDENEQRPRRFVFYHGRRNELLRPVLIEGSLYSPDSYTHLDSVNMNVASETYTYGEETGVGLTGNGSMYLGEGWSAPSPGHVWNNGYDASLRIPIQEPTGDLKLTLWLMPSIHDNVLPRQRIGLYVDNQPIAQWELDQRKFVRLNSTIPANLITSDELVIHFELPDAASQADLGVGGDGRLQAIALHRFKIDQE